MATKLLLSFLPVFLVSCLLSAQTVTVIESYPNKAPKQTSTMATDSSFSVLTDYFKNGKIQSIDTVINNHVNGWSTEYNDDGTVFVEQLFDFDKPIVQRFYLYYKDGILKSAWQSDTLGRVKDAADILAANGYWKEYYHNEKLKMEGRKNQNKNNDGTWIYYDENGKEV